MIRRIAVAATSLMALATLAVVAAMLLVLPARRGVRIIPGLSDRASIVFDEAGAPHIEATNREDAFAALGYATGGDRLFQMDLLRRKSAGRLAEIFGAELVPSDRWSRLMNFPRIADAVLAALGAEERRALEAYARGVDRAIGDAVVRPWEFLALGYSPEPWRARDSILVALTFADMSETIARERMATVMRAALPRSVADFLTPESDCYNEALAPRAPARCAEGARPPQEIRSLSLSPSSPAGVTTRAASKGSNAFAVAGAKTADGRAILASDMHLSLDTPDIWYRAHLQYGPHRMEGLVFPGTPLIVAGSNGRVAWGLTNLDGDLTDLVRLRPIAGEKRYATADGARDIVIRHERITVRGAPDEVFDARETVYGPVLPERLLGEEVALRWTMLDPAATNFDLMNMDRATDVRSALAILQGAGVPPLNAVVADDAGSIGWTIMGKIPKRRGFSGLVAEDWRDGGARWDGYLSSAELPMRVDPPEGFIASANQRMLAVADFSTEIGHDYSGGYRAFRIAELLRARGTIDEAGMGAIQLDASGDYYRYFRDVASEALRASARDPAADDLLLALDRWDGAADTESRGFALILAFHDALVDSVLQPLLERCRALEPGFRYVWANADAPARVLIEARRAGDRAAWNMFALGVLRRTGERIAASGALADLRWGEINRVEMPHPLSGAAPLLALLMDMPRAPLAGCPQCVRFYSAEGGKSLGANARLVVSPGHEDEALLQMAGGQSGQLGSLHYADLQADWVAGRWRAFRSSQRASELWLEPGASEGGER